MKYTYKGVEPCRIGSSLVQAGDVWEFADYPGALWMPTDAARILDDPPRPIRTIKPVAPLADKE